ncbi:uncharacterized protein L969DRAFT_610593 [Mixia osmundae IAM 14324]|uniref:Steroid 5-alpha reductase C-terminal domain-containing protein n=1 Tax=Mixia osmundae (strain CBS 9802 / IAM 14324 / JCM 22182 / KY 12970) TaxID=764103 RepID=G7DZH1_MIXOS|nr:uncharacterized protein L969DRAFT_610593 [Mixia osmundae IAM 14324]KEI37151.1 hypothetical protein L969DRAFT_610593 [Mixia osmundae IAM 14324]GAA95981.1 hypothetical protein E5Q_02639 [Mixia osmundae IAM 14324]
MFDRFGSIPPPHPALDPNTHLIPGLKAFIKAGAHVPTNLSTNDLTVATAQTWLKTQDPLTLSLVLCFWSSVVTWFLGEVTGNVSQVDRIWTFMPVIYSAILTLHPHWQSYDFKLFTLPKLSWSSRASWDKNFVDLLVPSGVDPRMMLILLLQVLWSLRLTSNAIRRGFFDPRTEDYRWPFIRERFPGGKLSFKVFNLVFIAFIQNIILMATALPQYVLLTSRASAHPTHAAPALGRTDLILTGWYLVNLYLEFVADNQHQRYQNWKHGSGREGRPGQVGKTARQMQIDEGRLRRGFCTEGLWAYSRHPNFLCEQTGWFILYLFSVHATVSPTVINTVYKSFDAALTTRSIDPVKAIAHSAWPHFFTFALAGPLSMWMIFAGSTWLTELISSRKYPLYKQYQRRVGRFTPDGTLLKSIWLLLTGSYGKVTEDVFGQAPKQIKSQ